MSRSASWFVAIPAIVFAVGCTDEAKKSAELAVPQTERLAKLVDADLADVKKGMPTGAKKLGESVFGAEGKELDPKQVRETLRKTRDVVADLQTARSTFFALTDANGVGIASDLEVDGFVGKNLVEVFPSLAKATKGETAEATGAFEAARGVQKGDDAQWVIATPVKGKDDKQRGIFVSGWSFRRYAQRLQEQLNTDFRMNLKKGDTARSPLLYVFVVVGDKAYGEPRAPEVNQKAVEGLKVFDKLQGETPWQNRVEIEGRAFGVAARRVNGFGDNAAIVILRSEV
ncbi:MAG: hypothetical protein U0165_19940 [Polyangiaceae bacterium]